MKLRAIPFNHFFALLVTSGLLTQAALASPAVDTRQANQSERITAGSGSGQLTLAEQTRLHAQQTRIANGESRAAADGTVTPREKHRLNARQTRASRHIARARHDLQKSQP